MAENFTGRRRMRKRFGSIAEVAEMPNLIEVQKSSYDQFLQMHIPADQRDDFVGIQDTVRRFAEQGLHPLADNMTWQDGALVEPLAVSVNTKGQIFLQNSEIQVEELVPKLQAIAAARGITSAALAPLCESNCSTSSDNGRR